MLDSSADVTVVIVTYNSAAVIDDCLRSVVSRLPAAEVIVVDNGSSDETVSVATRHPRVRSVVGHDNIGFGAAVNLGAAAASRSLLLVMNPDATLVEWDDACLAQLMQKPMVGLLGCRFREGARDRFIIFPFSSWRWELVWSMAKWFLVPREITVRRPHFPLRGRDQWVTGAAFVVRATEFQETGGFDANFFLYFEDFDLARTYHRASLPVATTNAFTVAHAAQKSSPRNEDRMIAFALLGLIQYVGKWRGSGDASRAAVVTLRLLDAIARTGRLLGVLPGVGVRALDKSRSAMAVRTSLAAALEDPPVEGIYPDAETRFVPRSRPQADIGWLDAEGIKGRVRHQ